MDIELEFWAAMDGLYPDIIKCVTSLSRRSYISITNLRTDITWWSQYAVDYFDLDGNFITRGKEKGSKRIHPDDIDVYRQGFKDRIAGKNLDKPWEYRICSDGIYTRFSAVASVINDNSGNPFIMIIKYTNSAIAEEIDSVTGLKSDAALARRINEYITTDQPAALLKLGLDQFSHINVMYGAAFSDKILNCVAQSLLQITHNIATVYRISGAKFVFAFDDISKKDLVRLHSIIVDTLANSIEVEEKKIPLKTSAGAIYIEPYMTETNAIRSRLTYALNHSRSDHHGDLVIFNDEACKNNEFELISVIHQCATNDFKGFRLFYQPIADNKTGRICGMEALIRWQLEPYGLVSPGVFMEWIEEDPCIFDLGNWVLKTALTDIKKLRSRVPGFFVNVNISAAQLERKEFRKSVTDILRETGSSPDELCLELTERCRNLDINFLRNEVTYFRNQGIKVALDDFGTGSSSLSLALELPFDELKVDMSFIRDIKNKPQNQAMVQSIVDYAKRTNTETCIEGIEDEEVNKYISQFGATWHQGYYYSKPVPIEQFEQII